MTLIEKLSNLGGIVDRDEMAKACSEIPDEDTSRQRTSWYIPSMPPRTYLTTT